MLELMTKICHDWLLTIITSNPLDTLPVNSQDFQRISAKLDSQICVKASVSREEKVCCDDDSRE